MHILCVDDDGLVRSVTADLLRDLGHEVTEANGGGQAAALIAAGCAIDMLVTDIHMPGGPGGVELAMLGRQARPGLPVVYFSGLDHIVPIDVAGRVLRKPCTLGELQRVVGELQAQVVKREEAGYVADAS